MKVLVAGAAGLLARRVVLHLLEVGHEVIGIDGRPWEGAPKGFVFHRVDVRKRAAEDVFRRHTPEAVIHMATVTHLLERSAERYRINLESTRAIFELADRYGVKRVTFVGRHTYYGAGPDSPLYHLESEPPASGAPFLELADLVAADLYAGAALWRFPDIATAVLRVCYTLGPSRHGTLANFLAGQRVPTVLGFDPLFQFLHEEDATHAIVLAMDRSLRGVYNVAGPSPIPLSVIIRETGRTPLPVPEFVLNAAFGRFGLPKLPRGAISHLKYPIVIDAGPFRSATGFAHKHNEQATLRAFRELVPPRVR